MLSPKSLDLFTYSSDWNLKSDLQEIYEETVYPIEKIIYNMNDTVNNKYPKL